LEGAHGVAPKKWPAVPAGRWKSEDVIIGDGGLGSRMGGQASF
jgi:hypothetical protein